jgi:HK97 family phage portal protein
MRLQRLLDLSAELKEVHTPRINSCVVALFRRAKPDEDRSLKQPTTWPVYPSYPPIAPDDLGPDVALRLADVLACVRAISDSLAALPLVPYRRIPEGGRERFSGRIADLLNRPSPAATQANLIGTIAGHLVTRGNCYVGKFRGPDGIVDQLVCLPPQSVIVELDAGEPVYTYLSLQGSQRLTSADVLHIRGLSLDGIVGISPITQARQAVSLANNLSSHADSFAKNSGRPGGILRVGGWRSAQGTGPEDLRADWNSTFQGEAQSGKLLILSGEGDIQYQQFALSMADAEFVQQRMLSTAEIARIFRLHPHLIGSTVPGDRQTYANSQDLVLQFAKFTLGPWATVIEQAFSNDADLSPATVYLEFLFDSLLRADAPTRAATYTLALNPSTGWMSRAEVRELENLPPEEEPPEPVEPPEPTPEPLPVPITNIPPIADPGGPQNA